MNNVKHNNLEEDWNFDLSEFEEDIEEDIENSSVSLLDIKKPNVTGLKSKYSAGELNLQLLVDIKRNITKFSIDVGSRQADLSVLWKYYALLDEFWCHMKDIYGLLEEKRILKIKKKCYFLLRTDSKNNSPSQDLYNWLLYWRSCLYKLYQFANLGIEVEKYKRGGFYKAKRKITE